MSSLRYIIVPGKVFMEMYLESRNLKNISKYDIDMNTPNFIVDSHVAFKC